MEILNLVVTVLLSMIIIVLLVTNNKSKREELKKPIIIMTNGAINKDAMNAANISIEELMSRARISGYFNLGDIDTAIMETSGKISFLPSPMKRPLNPKDFNFAPVREGLCRIIISNGKINRDNLLISGIDEDALNSLLEQRESALEDIMLATINEAGRVDFFNK